MSSLFTIDAPHMYASGKFSDDGKVYKAAPIIKYMIGWTAQKVEEYAAFKGWKVINTIYE